MDRTMDMDNLTNLDGDGSTSCPVPNSQYDHVVLGHGSGGKLMNNLLDSLILKYLNSEYLEKRHDGAIIDINRGRMAISTDSFVVNPIFFPGGNIGELAVNGTVNDLAMCGAVPYYLTVALILEEGLPLDDLELILAAMRASAAKTGIQIITGDTKVVERGKGDQIFINTTGVGMVPEGINISADRIKPGDKIIINGPIANHGIAIIASREGLSFESTITSDTMPLNDLVMKMIGVDPKIKMLRDATRGGIASSLKEIASSCQYSMTLFEDQIPMDEDVKAACEMLGFDPLYVANEGKMVAFVSEEKADKVLAVMRKHPAGKRAAIIGQVEDEVSATVRLKTVVGSYRMVEMLSGEQLPRIC